MSSGCPFSHRALTRSPFCFPLSSLREHCLIWQHLLNTSPVQPPDKPDIHSEHFLHSLMRRQLRLSIICATAFLLVLLGLPLANYFWPELMATRLFGFTLTWLILGIGFFPAVWLIAWFFIRRSIALEDAEVSELQSNDEPIE